MNHFQRKCQLRNQRLMWFRKSFYKRCTFITTNRSKFNFFRIFYPQTPHHHPPPRPLPKDPPTPTPTPEPGNGINRSKLNLLRQGHITSQIKGITKCSDMEASILPQTPLPPPPPWDGVSRSKFNVCRSWSCCISNKRESRLQLLCSQSPTPPPPDPLDRVNR